MNYYISDTHFFHKNVTAEGKNFDNRPFATLDEMHEEMRKRWNNTVTNADHVYILGDLVWKVTDETIRFVRSLNGNKHLILGNHDHIKNQKYRSLFEEVVNYKELKDDVDQKEYRVVLSHYPLAFWNHQHHHRKNGEEHDVWAVQLYGHVHNSEEERYFQEFIHKLNTEYGEECVAKNAGCMFWNYTPVTLKQILTEGNQGTKR